MQNDPTIVRAAVQQDRVANPLQSQIAVQTEATCGECYSNQYVSRFDGQMLRGELQRIVHVALFVGTIVLLHNMLPAWASLLVAYLLVKALASSSDHCHSHVCRQLTMAAVGTMTTVAVSLSFGVVASGILIVCPSPWLWWPSSARASPEVVGVPQLPNATHHEALGASQPPMCETSDSKMGQTAAEVTQSTGSSNDTGAAAQAEEPLLVEVQEMAADAEEAAFGRAMAADDAEASEQLAGGYRRGDPVRSLVDEPTWTPHPLVKGANGTVTGPGDDAEMLEVDFGNVTGDFYPYGICKPDEYESKAQGTIALYLPMRIDGVGMMLEPQGGNRWQYVDPTGKNYHLSYRQSKLLHDKTSSVRSVRSGDVVQGVDMGDGWLEVDFSQAAGGDASGIATAVRQRLARLKARLPKLTKRRVVAARSVLTALVVLVIMVFGILERDDLLTRTSHTLKAAQDDQCHVYIRPYGADNTEYRFEISKDSSRNSKIAHAGVDGKVRVQVNSSSPTHSADESWSVVAGINAHSGSIQPQLGQAHRLAARECILLVNNSGTEPTSNLVLSYLNNGSRHPLDFSGCVKRTDDDNVQFQESNYDKNTARHWTNMTLAFFFLLRVVALAREWNCIEYDTLYPIWPRSASRPDMPLWGRMLGNRELEHINWRYVFPMAVRPYLLFFVVPAQLLKPWTTIRLHDQCPQVVMQTGDVRVVIMSCFLGVTVLGVVCMLYCLDAQSIYFDREETIMFEASGNDAADDVGFRVSDAMKVIDIKKGGRAEQLGVKSHWTVIKPDNKSSFEADMMLWDHSNAEKCPLEFRFDKHQFKSRFLGGAGQEHIRLNFVPKMLCLGVAVSLLVMIALSWPHGIILELDYIFELHWASFALSRWAHLLRIAALCLFTMDTCFFLAKFFGDAPLVGDNLAFASPGLKSDPKAVLREILENGRNLAHASSELKDDKNIVLAAVTQDGNALSFAGEGMKNTEDIVLAAVTQNGKALSFASDDMKNNREILLAAFQQMGMKFTTEEMKDKRSIVIAAVQQDGRVLEHAGEGMKNDAAIVAAAVQEDWSVFEGVSWAMKCNETVVVSAINSIIKEYPNKKGNPDSNQIWIWLPEEMKRNETVRRAACE